MSEEVPEEFIESDLPPEPGLIGDPDLGVPDSEVVFDDEGDDDEFDTEINDDEEEEEYEVDEDEEEAEDDDDE